MGGLAVPIPYNWAVGDIGNMALLDAQIRDPMTFFLNVPIFSTAQTAVQSIATGSLITLTWPAPPIDTYGGWAAGAPTKYTPQVPGYYEIDAVYQAAANATGDRLALIQKNGTTIAQVSGPAATASDSTGVPVRAPLVACNGTTDFIEIVAVQRSGVALNTVVALTQFSAKWVHAL
ncbi:hypothetical protein ACEZCY_14760 [Streptacidiphilus sp. N1-12]|uniref:Uncharacterized protein n=2 Tax=Streptacidiphilus alkalitolerans TaxID=3342712 RepID=A0ABV6V9W6_9ACTN